MKDEMSSASVDSGPEKVGPIRQYFRCFRLDTKSVAANAIIAALYVALTYAFWYISYQPVQVRVSEFLVLLVFFNPNYTFGLCIGCALADIYSIAFATLTPFDILFGTLATFLACIAMSLCRHLWIASLMPAIFNGFILAFEFSWTAGMFPFQNPENVTPEASRIFYWTNFGYVFLGELVAVSILGYLLFRILTKRVPRFYSVINAKRNLAYRW
jgi:uncharacterized membrane protein